jgi:hypothetical protein
MNKSTNLFVMCSESLVLTCHTRLAEATELVEPTHAHSISYSEVGNVVDRGTDLGDDSNTFMSESLLSVTVVLIRAADAAVRYLNDGLSWFGVAMAFGLDDFSGFGAFEDCGIDSHSCRCNRIKSNERKYQRRMVMFALDLGN